MATAPVVVAYHLDGLSLLFVTLAAAVSLAVVAGAQPGVWARGPRPPILAIASLAGLLGVVVAGDLIVLYVCWETLGLLGHLAAAPSDPDELDSTSGPSPYLVGHLAGYGLLAAALLLARASGGTFQIGALSPEPWAAVLPGLVLAAALGRIYQAWAGPARRRDPLGDLARLLLTLSCAYLLARALALAGGAWTPAWSAIALVCGAAALVALLGPATGIGPFAGRRRWRPAMASLPGRAVRCRPWLAAARLAIGIGWRAAEQAGRTAVDRVSRLEEGQHVAVVVALAAALLLLTR